MISETLNLWDNGAVTLPKEWRERYGTKHYLAKENAQGYLVIMPILDMEYYEGSDEAFGLRFPTGIEAGELLQLMKKAQRKTKPKRSTRKSKQR